MRGNMKDEMKSYAIYTGIRAVNSYMNMDDEYEKHKKIATEIQDQFDAKYGTCWCVLVGHRDNTSYLTFYGEENTSGFFNVDDIEITCFRSRKS